MALTDKPTKVLDPASCKDDGRRIENVKQEVGFNICHYVLSNFY